jgi:hypothetical protein
MEKYAHLFVRPFNGLVTLRRMGGGGERITGLQRSCVLVEPRRFVLLLLRSSASGRGVLVLVFDRERHDFEPHNTRPGELVGVLRVPHDDPHVVKQVVRSTAVRALAQEAYWIPE